MASLVVTLVTKGGEAHVADTAFEGFLTGVGALVHFEVAFFTEGFAATGAVTNILWFCGLDMFVHVMDSEPVFASESLSAVVALEPSSVAGNFREGGFWGALLESKGKSRLSS